MSLQQHGMDMAGSTLMRETSCLLPISNIPIQALPRFIIKSLTHSKSTLKLQLKVPNITTRPIVCFSSLNHNIVIKNIAHTYMEVRRKLMLKSLITKVVNSLSFLAHIKGAYYYPPASDIDDDDDDDDDDENDEAATSSSVPEDVREGQFVVIAMEGEERKRFIVELDYLRDPEFLRLLEQAGEEYGFGQKGALAVPCTPLQLQKIIENRRVVDNATT